MVASNIAQPHDGKNGTNGTNGTNGLGYPAGGTTGQVLAKIDGTDYNTHWIDPQPSGVASVVQVASAVGASISSVTLASAPIAGNMLIAICATAVANAGDGWTLFISDSSGNTYSRVFYKLAGSGESATQTPFASAQNCELTIFELSAGTAASVIWGSSNSSASTKSLSAYATSLQGLFIGVSATESSVLQPTSVPGTAAADASNITANKAVTAFYATPTNVGAAANTLSTTYAVSTNTRFLYIFVR